MGETFDEATRLISKLRGLIGEVKKDMETMTEEDKEEYRKELSKLDEKYMKPIDQMLNEEDPIKRKEMAQRHLDENKKENEDNG
jgi:Sec-independent protein translocase protein TatA